MSRLSTRQAAKRLGIHPDTLAHYVAVEKVPAPEIVSVGTGKRTVHAWTEADIKRVRKLLPTIANGRKTRYKRKHSEARSQESEKPKTKTKKPPPRAAVPHKQSKKK